MTDYTVYDNHYQYMKQILNSLQQQRYAIGTQRTVQTSFSDVFQSAQQTTVEAPESMDAIFEEAAEKYDVPLNLLKALAKVESDFQTDVVSSAGAQGVMQLMPGTAKAMGVTDPFDARDNIMGGAKLMGRLLKQYDGNIDLALAAYGAGEGAVQKYGGVPPYPETINHIKKVKSYMGMDLSANKMVETSQSAQQGSSTGYMLNDTVTGNEIGSAMYIMEMMRLRLQMMMTTENQLI